MERETLTTQNFISSVNKFHSNSDGHGTIQTLLKNFLSETNNMAIKENQRHTDKYVYTIPVTTGSQVSDRMTSISEAKRAFLNSTVESQPKTYSTQKKEDPVLHYAQLAMVTESEDSRSTGGGKAIRRVNSLKNKHKESPTSVKLIEQRKVSFKIKSVSSSHRKPPLSTKTMIITNNKVSELTQKFNKMTESSPIRPVRQSKSNKLVEEKSVSSNSNPSSPLSSSPNIKIILRQRRGSRRRYNKKRCSSVDEIDKLVSSESPSKLRVNRSKSDGTKIPKTPKKRIKSDSSGQNSGTDSVDGTPSKNSQIHSAKIDRKSENSVKDVIKKFETEIKTLPKLNHSVDRLQHSPETKNVAVRLPKEKPKVPEKKSSLTLTKNVVVKDGIPKIKSIRPITSCSPQKEVTIEKEQIGIHKKREPLYDKLKYKTNYIHSDKLPLKVVEIIQEESNKSENYTSHHETEIIKEEIIEQEIINQDSEEKIKTEQKIEENQYICRDITANDSFLWRRKSHNYSDSEKLIADGSYSLISLATSDYPVDVSENYDSSTLTYKKSHIKEMAESPSIYEPNSTVINIECNTTNADFESNLVEAVNKEVVIGFTPNSLEGSEFEDGYEPLEPKDLENIVIIPVKSFDKNIKANCPLPEIPKQVVTAPPSKDNIYQCLMEMRSLPEGDENCMHNYEDCETKLEERTRGDGDSDDGYEYCKAPIKPFCITSSSGIQIAENYNPVTDKDISKNYGITKSVSSASTVSYEKIGPDRIYEKIPLRPPKSKDSSPSNSSNRNSLMSDYTSYNEGENIYDTIKQGDAASLSHCYESIPNSPSMVKMRQNMRKTLVSSVQKRLSFDNVSNISQSTLSSEQKTNSIYGQRSVVSYNGQEIAFPVPTSESGSSDRSDDWVDISDDEKNDEQKIIIIQERGRGRKSPISWSQKVRHQWHKKPKQKTDEKVFVSSPTNVYIQTSEKSPYYSVNDESVDPPDRALYENGNVQKPVHVYDAPELPNWLSVRTLQRHGNIEVQDLIAFLDCESSDSGHVYESLEPAPSPPAPAPPPLDDDFDSFDSDTDDDDKPTYNRPAPPLPASRLPEPPSGNHTLTKIANAAQKKMRQIKRNLTKRYSVALDGNPFRSTSNSQNGTYDIAKKTKSAIYSDYEKTEIQHIYSNISFNDTRSVLSKTEIGSPKNGFKEELKNIIGEKRISNGDITSPVSEKLICEKPVTPTSEGSKKGSDTLSRKTYFSFKSRFRRATSMAVDINTDVPSALKITNSTFYLTDSMDGDSGFSNCSDNGNTSTEAPTAPRRQNGKLRHAWSESSPCLALERPSCPPPPPPIVTSPQPMTHEPQLSAVNEELKRLLPTLSRKEKSPRTRTSWYADCDSSAGTSEWYSENGVYQTGNISTSSGASSASHPASPLPHSLFTHEPLYQFYNAAKVESVCRDDSDSEAYECPPARARPTAMALVAPRGPQRTLWCEVPEVLASTVLSSLAPAQKRLQEAKFELLTSEASYLNSLNVLEAHFISHPAFRDTGLLPRCDWETLFGTILPVKRCSQLLMNELEKCWQDNILLQGICDIVRTHAEEHFQVYVKYCENQALMVKALQRLREKGNFAAALKRLESHPSCQSLSLHSFLMLPMQRVTRLPLLLDAVLKNLAAEDGEYDGCMHALATLNSFVSQCNEGARNTERVEEMYRIAQSIEFPASMENAPVLGPACSRRDKRPVRWLVRSGEMTHLVWKADEMKLTFGKKFHKIPLHLFLFNDLLVITKKKGENNFLAVDYCPRSLLEVCASDNTAGVKRALLLTLLENSHGKTVEMLLSCASETDVSRWVEALAPAESSSGDAVYAGWDCPQVVAVFAYLASQPDELALAEGDVVNVARKTSEGWYYGERTRDGQSGWFPGAYTAEVMSAHVRARNLRQRYRLLALSATYLGQRKT